MDQVIVLEQLEKWKRLAEKASTVEQMVSWPRPGKGMIVSLVDQNYQIMAKGLNTANGMLFFEARRAVLAMSAELITLRLYAEYVRGVVELAEVMAVNKIDRALLPMTYEEWLSTREG